jgi:hypothetical protein
METFEEPGNFADRYANAGIGDGDYRIGVIAVYPDDDGALEGELQRIGEQVEHHLLPHLAVQIHRLVERRAVHCEGQAGPVDRRPEDAGQFGGDG